MIKFDNDKNAMLMPSYIESKLDNCPKTGVTFFSNKIMKSFLENFDYEIISEYSMNYGKQNIYKVKYNDSDILVYQSPMGASQCVATCEEVFAKGLEKLVVFGTCGVLSKDIEDLAIVIPNMAVREEGTSYHYIEPSDEIICNPKYIDDFKTICKEHSYSYTVGKTWTTDAPYRETASKVKQMQDIGCISVEMECSALRALADFREKDLFQFFYAADSLASTNWDKRSLGSTKNLDEKTKIIFLALELASTIDKK